MSKKENWIFSQAYYDKQKSVKEFASYTHTELVSHIYELRIHINTLQQIIDKQQEDQTRLSKKTFIGYQQEWSYATKIVFIISEMNNPLLSIEIHKQLMLLDHRFKSMQRQQTTLSSIISRSCKTGRIAKYKVKGKKELLFVLPNWLDKSGELKEIYSKDIALY